MENYIKLDKTNLANAMEFDEIFDLLVVKMHDHDYEECTINYYIQKMLYESDYTCVDELEELIPRMRRIIKINDYQIHKPDKMFKKLGMISSKGIDLEYNEIVNNNFWYLIKD